MAILMLVVLLHIRISAIAKRVSAMERTGVLIEDVRAANLKQLKPATPRQKLKYIERVMNSRETKHD
jgi:hypothetical protein